MSHRLAHLALLALAACAVDPVATAEDVANVTTPLQPRMIYSRQRPSEAETYPQFPSMTFRILDSAVVQYLSTRTQVSYTVTYQPLWAASGITMPIPGQALITPIPVGVPPPFTRTIQVNLNSPTLGLYAMSVWRMKIQLLDDTGAALGAESDLFYTVSGNTSTSPSNKTQLGRLDIVLLGFVQLGDQEEGRIGAGGTLEPDGTRFVSVNHPHYNPGDELTGWCDWFYHYLGVMVTDGLDGNYASDPVTNGGNTFWHTMNPNNVPNAFRDPSFDGCGTELVDLDHNGHVGDTVDTGCQDLTTSQVKLDKPDNQFFSNISTNIYYDADQSLAINQHMGNYQAMDSHAGVFLDYDPTAGMVWSLEGNDGDKVKVTSRPATSTMINAFGKLEPLMFQN